MGDGQAVRSELIRHGVTPSIVGIDDHHRALDSGGTVLQREVDRGHRTVTATLQTHAVHAIDVGVNRVPTSSIACHRLMLRKPCWNLSRSKNRVDVRQNGPAKSCAHRSRCSQNVYVSETLDGGKQTHHGSAIIGWRRKQKDAVHVGQHERRRPRVPSSKGFRDVPRHQAWVKATRFRLHPRDGFRKGAQARILLPERPLQTLLCQTIVEPKQALCSTDAPRGGWHQKRASFGQGMACVVQSEQVKGRICVCFRQTNISPKVPQKTSERGDAGGIDRPAAPRHATHVVPAFPLRCTNDEHGLLRHRLVHPCWEWAEGNDLEGRHAPKTASGFLNTLRCQAMLLQKGSRFIVEDDQDSMCNLYRDL